MKGSRFLALIDSLQSRNRGLGIALVVLAGLNIANLVALFAAQAHVQTVVVPIGGEGMQIGNGKADARYIRRTARYIINQLGTYSAATAKDQYHELLQMFAPSQITAAGVYFDKLVADIERYPSISSIVEWAGQNPLKYTSDMIQVVGVKERLVNGEVTDRKGVHYCIRYHIEDARFYIDNVQEKEDAGTDLCFIDKPAAPGQDAAAAAAAGGK